MPEIRGTVAPKDRTQLQVTARGLIAETVPSAATASASIPTAGTTNGTLVLSLLGLRQGDVATNLLCFVTITGAALTLVKLGLYDSTGVLLRATGESSASFNSGTGYKQIALSSPYTVTADGGYYVGFLQFGSGATGATLRTPGSVAGMGSQIGSAARVSAQVVTQTDIAGNVTLADANLPYWFAVS